MIVAVSRLLGAVLVLAVLSVPWGRAADGADELPLPAAPESVEENAVDVFILGNTLATFCTELARALVGELDLEPPGLLHEAIDTLALLLLLPSEPDPQRDDLVRAAVDGWAMAADRRGEPEEPLYWVAGGVDEQRFASLTCLLVGSDPDSFADLAEEIGLAAEDVTHCVEEYDRAVEVWSGLLAEHGRATRSRRSRGGTIRIAYDDAPGFQPLRDLLRDSGTLETAAAEILSSLYLPRTLTVRFASCGEENAGWQPGERQILICWELVRAFDRLARADAGGSDAPADEPRK